MCTDWSVWMLLFLSVCHNTCEIESRAVLWYHPLGMASWCCRGFWGYDGGNEKGKAFGSLKLGPSNTKSHHQIKLLVFSFSTYLFGELIDRQQNVVHVYFGGGLQTRRPTFSFLFGGLRPREHFFPFFQIFLIPSEICSLLCTPRPYSQASKLIAFYFSKAYSGSSYGRKRRLTFRLTLLDRCEMIDPGGIIDTS